MRHGDESCHERIAPGIGRVSCCSRWSRRRVSVGRDRHRSGVFGEQANGSLIERADAPSARVCSASRSRARSTSGAALRRPVRNPTTARSSSGSNQGPINPALETAVKDRIAALRAADPGNTARARRPRDCVGQRARSAHLAGGRGVSGRSRRAARGTAPSGASASSCASSDRGPNVRHSW